MTEKLYYGLMIFFIAVAVLVSPFAYMRSLRFLDRRFKNQQFRDHTFRQPETSDSDENPKDQS